MAKLGKFSVLMSLIAFLFTWAALAEVTGVTASVDRNSMAVGDTFTYSVSIESSSSISVDQPEWPNFNGFDLVNNWSGNELKSMYDNGKFVTKRKQTFNLQLQARQEGVFEIGATTIKIEGRSFSTKPITLSVAAASARRPNLPRAQRQNPGATDVDDMFSKMIQDRMRRFRGAAPAPQGPSQDRADIQGNELFFIDVVVDKNKVYEGEQLTATYYLYSRGRVAEIDTLKYPTLAGFWKEDIELATRLNFKPAIINGIRYNRALLASYALFPIKAGKAVVDPYKAKCKVINAANFGIPRTAEDTQASSPINIEVIPVPEATKPQDFAGAVGQFSVSTTVDNPSPKTSQPVTINYKFEGRGNAKLIEIPEINVPVGLDRYDSSSKSKYFKNGQSFKDFEILFVPRQVGPVTVPSLTLSLFDPVKKTYYSLKTDEITLNVQKGEELDQLPSSVLANDGTGALKKSNVLPAISLAYESKSYMSAMTYIWAPIYLFIFSFLIWFSRIELGWGKKRDSLKRLVYRRTKRIREKLSSKELRQAGSDATNLVYFVLGELSGLGGGSQELKKMMAKAPPSFRRDYQEPLEKLMRELEVIAFAPEEVAGQLKNEQQVNERVKAVESLLLKAIEQDFNENTEDIV